MLLVPAPMEKANAVKGAMRVIYFGFLSMTRAAEDEGRDTDATPRADPYAAGRADRLSDPSGAEVRCDPDSSLCVSPAAL